MDEAQKIHEDGVIFVKNRKIRCPVITACCFLLTSLETRCGAHPSSFRTSAIQAIFKVPSTCIIMRIISENDDRTTRFACVRPSTVSTTRKTPIVSMALRHPRRCSWQPQALQMVHPALRTHVSPPILRTAHTNVQLRHISRECAHSPALGCMRSDAIRLAACSQPCMMMSLRGGWPGH